MNKFKHSFPSIYQIYDSLETVYYNVKHGIKNLYNWIPIIWKDRDYDQLYIYDILKTKLEHQAKYFIKSDICESDSTNARYMLLCSKLIEKIKNGDYENEYVEYYVSEFNWNPVANNSDLFELEIIDKSENFDDYFKKYPLIYKKVITEKLNNNDAKFSIAVTIAYINHDRAKKLLFKIIEQNIDGWWN